MEKWERISENAKNGYYAKLKKNPWKGLLLGIFTGFFGIAYSKPVLGIVGGFVQTYFLTRVIINFIYLSKSNELSDECVNMFLLATILWVVGAILSPFFCKLSNENLKEKIWRI